MKSLGIMTGGTPDKLPPSDLRFLTGLCEYGRKCGLAAFVFGSESLHTARRTVIGYTPDRGRDRWIAREVPIPDLIYDRFFPDGRTAWRRHSAAMQRMAALKPLLLLGNGLRGKADVYKALRSHPLLGRHLPRTVRYRAEALTRALAAGTAVFMKPEFGTHGKGTLRITAENTGGAAPCFRVCGRTRGNLPIERLLEPHELAAWVGRFIGGSRYLMQPYLELHTDDGTAYDIRALVQKNGSGRWQLTGSAARVGGAGSLTSNLHGGGSACEPLPLLRRQFGDAEAERLMHAVTELSLAAAHALEARFGRLAELGIDIGIDTAGRLWLIEANSKPGRASLRVLDDPEAAERSVRNPLLYAKYVLERAEPHPRIARVPI